MSKDDSVPRHTCSDDDVIEEDLNSYNAGRRSRHVTVAPKAESQRQSPSLCTPDDVIVLSDNSHSFSECGNLAVTDAVSFKQI